MPSRIQSDRLGTVDVMYWNPLRQVLPGRLGRVLPLRRRPNNFGDLLGPVIAAGMLARSGTVPTPQAARSRLFVVGSILHFAQDGDVVWGTGRNGKIADSAHVFTGLDVRAVRGPRTREFLAKRGIDAPEVYGDPALLLPLVRPDLRGADAEHPVTVVANLNDEQRRGPEELSPSAPLEHCLQRLSRSALVVGSSLHGIIVAEALGIPARLVRPGHEDPSKYYDYYEGTGRSGVEFADSVEEAKEMGGAEPLHWDPQPLVDSFPHDLWVEREGIRA